MQPSNIQQTHIDISHARLSSYQNFFQCHDPQEVYGIYCWNEAISGALFRLISITEVVMRNRFHVALSQHFYSAMSVGSYEANDWYNHVGLTNKSQVKVRGVTHKPPSRRGQQWTPKRPMPTSNDVVSQMTFGFWLKLLDARAPWENLIPNVLPGHRHREASHWKKLRNQDALYARIDLVNRLRNRIAHFEPVWKQKALR
ncbi:MAG: Abi family protein, partial [Pseudomonadota bacterium]|nr:Abi family protein [Pseudomonadota bacterium]